MNDEPKLLPCPFCGGDAEIDTRRGYRQLPTGVVGSGVAIYCTNCSSDMMHCYEDHSGVDRDDLRADLVGAWNKRAAEAAAFRRGVEAMRVATWRALDCSGGRDSPTYTSLISGHYPCPCGNGRVPTGAYRMACNVAASAIAALPPPEDGP